MEYTLNYVKNKINPGFSGLRNDIESLKLQKNINGIHNQNRISLDFFSSNLYKDNTYYDTFFEYYRLVEEEDKRPYQIEVFTEIQEQYMELDKKLSKKSIDDLDYSDLQPYLPLLVRHLDVYITGNTNAYQKGNVVHCRFGCNRLSHGLNENDVVYVLENTKKLKDLLENNYDFSTKLDLNWHTFLTTCWTLIEGGVGEVSLYVANSILPLFEIELEEYKSAAQNTFVALYRSFDVRSNITVLWVKAIALKQLNKIDEAKQTLQTLIDLLLNSPHKPAVLCNRATEASILLYTLEPTEANMIQAKQLLLRTAAHPIPEPTESTRERGLIIYDFCKQILKVDI